MVDAVPSMQPHPTLRPRNSVILARAAQLADDAISQTVATKGLRLDEWRVLDHLAIQGQSTMSEIAAAALLTGPTLTRTVDRLVTTGLTHRTVDLADRRRVLVHLTRRGKELHRQLAASVVAAEDSLLSSLCSAEPALRDLASRLRP